MAEVSICVGCFGIKDGTVIKRKDMLGFFGLSSVKKINSYFFPVFSSCFFFFAAFFFANDGIIFLS